MTARRIFFFLLLAGASVPARAQVITNDVLVVDAVTSEFSVLRPGVGVTHFPIGAFGGPGATGTAQSILWDPVNPSIAIIGGFGFVGRAVIAGATATYAPITTGISTAAQMSLDGAGFVVVADAGVDQIRRVDPATGVVTNVTSGTQPWGANLNAGAVDPYTGDIYAGGNGGIWKIPYGTVTPLPFASGWTAGTSFVSWINFDPQTHEVLAGLLTVSRVVRISSAGVLTDLVTPGAISAPNSVEFDANGDFIVCGSTSSVFRIPYLGGAPVLLGTVTGPTSSLITGASVANDVFRMFVNPVAGGGAITLGAVPSNVLEGFTVATFDTALPPNAGAILGISPDALTFALLSLSPTATPGDLIHWTWPVAPPLYPAAPFFVPPGTISGVTLDFVSVGFDALSILHPTPPVRATF